MQISLEAALVLRRSVSTGSCFKYVPSFLLCFKARRDQNSSSNSVLSFLAFLSCLSLYFLKYERRVSNHL